MSDSTTSIFVEMRNRWVPVWRVWRSRDDHDMPVSWVATFQLDDDESPKTLMEPTPEALGGKLRAVTIGSGLELEPKIGVYAGGV